MPSSRCKLALSLDAPARSVGTDIVPTSLPSSESATHRAEQLVADGRVQQHGVISRRGQEHFRRMAAARSRTVQTASPAVPDGARSVPLELAITVAASRPFPPRPRSSPGICSQNALSPTGQAGSPGRSHSLPACGLVAGTPGRPSPCLRPARSAGDSAGARCSWTRSVTKSHGPDIKALLGRGGR